MAARAGGATLGPAGCPKCTGHPRRIEWRGVRSVERSPRCKNWGSISIANWRAAPGQRGLRVESEPRTITAARFSARPSARGSMRLGLAPDDERAPAPSSPPTPVVEVRAPATAGRDAQTLQLQREAQSATEPRFSSPRVRRAPRPDARDVPRQGTRLERPQLEDRLDPGGYWRG